MGYSYGSKAGYRYSRGRSRPFVSALRSSGVRYRSGGFSNRSNRGQYKKRYARYSASVPFRRAKRYSSAGRGGGVSSRKAVEQVVARTVAKSDPTRNVPDSVALNGFRARVTCLTSPSVVRTKISEFNGRVQWVGVTCNTTYEISGAGPFVHRRVLFKSTIPWPAQTIIGANSNPAGGIGAGECIRATASDLSDGKLVGCLRRLFSQDTVRGVVQGPVANIGITVLKDETLNTRGLDDGVRKEKKYWNTLKKEVMMQYNILPDGSFDFSLANAPDSQHVYLADIYSYGLEGLDSSLPDPRMQSSEAPSGAKADASTGDPPVKRQRSDDSVMSGTSNDSFGVNSLREALRNPMVENEDGGVAKISSVMKVYFREA